MKNIKYLLKGICQSLVKLNDNFYSFCLLSQLQLIIAFCISLFFLSGSNQQFSNKKSNNDRNV
jgi:hypothetical protein